MATIEPPDDYFHWILRCYNLQAAGYTIDNKQLTLAEWEDLGTMKCLLENKHEKERLSSVSYEMLSLMVKAVRRR